MNRLIARSLKSLALALPFAAGVALASPPSADLAPPPVVEPIPVPAVDGAAVYTASCAKCHGEDGKGDTKIGRKFKEDGKRMPDLVVSTLSKDEVAKIIADGVDGTPMKAYAKKLSKDELAAVVAFTMGLRGN